MNLKAALGLCQLFSVVVFVTIARWYVAPWLRARDRATALTVLLWPHVFRYIALQAYSAQHSGFPISDAGLRNIVVGDIAGAIVALVAIAALRHASRIAVPLVWVLVVSTVIDTVLNVSDGIREHLFGKATAVSWMVVGIYVPILMVSVGLTVWQLIARRDETVAAHVLASPRVARRMSLAG